MPKASMIVSTEFHHLFFVLTPYRQKLSFIYRPRKLEDGK